MFGFPRRHARPIAIDVGAESVKMLQLSSSTRVPAVVAASCRARTSAASLSDLVRQMLDDAPFQGRRAVGTLPAEMVHTRTLRLPLEPVNALDAIRPDWSHHFSFDIEDAAVRFLTAGVVKQGGEVRREVIVFAARHGDVREFHNELQSAGLTVASLQVSPIAGHSVMRTLPANDSSTALLELGAARSTLLIAAGSTLSFVKSFDVGGRDFEQAVASRLSLDVSEARQLFRRLALASGSAEPRRNPVASAVFDATRALAEDLAHQVAMCFRYHAITFRGRRPAQLFLAGGQSTDLNLQRTLSHALGISATPMDPFAGTDTAAMRPSDRENSSGRWAVCVGLGLLTEAAGISNVPAIPLRRAA